MTDKKIEIERQEPLELPEENYDAFAKNSDSEQVDSEMDDIESRESGVSGEEEYDEEEELTPEEESSRKRKALISLENFRQNKTHIPHKHFGMDSDLYELEDEVEYVRQKIKSQTGVKWSRNLLIMCTVGMEMGAAQFNPESRLIGWKDTVEYDVNTGTYDDVLQELFEKYGGDTTFFGPELRLAYMLIQSATVHYMMNQVTPKRQQRTVNSNTFQDGRNTTDIDTNDTSDTNDIKQEIKTWTGISSNTAEAYEDLMTKKTKKGAK